MFNFTPSLDFFSYNIPNFEKYLDSFKNIKCDFLEIGSFEGRSAIWLLQNILTNENSTLICIENGMWLNAFNTLIHNFNELPNNAFSKVRLLKENSTTALCKLIIEQKHFSFIYIDAQHHDYMPLYDMILSHELIHNSGIIAIDDYGAIDSEQYGTFNVKNCFDVFYSIYKKYYEILLHDYQVWIKRI